ncbi:trem-like transcript 2 protein [Tamandua tetradactyla]|uniref:trem-like transcript 2 protein n=1 Tax=Tamandua tetradactyla TaxID=48850 RepID=UPI0040549518
MPPAFLLLLLWLPGGVSGAPAESVYTRVRHVEGETMSVQCPYMSRKNHVEGKVWCKVRRKRCEPGFTRVWAQGPRYSLRDDIQARVVTITMESLRLQDSGRYWCMRNSSQMLYPLMGILLEVSPAPTTERNIPRTLWAHILKSGIVVSKGQAPTSGRDTPSPTGMILLAPGLPTSARLLPSTASGTIKPTSMAGYSFTSTTTSTTSMEPGRTVGSQTVTEFPSKATASSAGPAPISTTSRHLSTWSPTSGLCHTSRSLLNKLPPIRHQDWDPTLLVGVLVVFPVPVMLVMLYGFWKSRHMGSYRMSGGPIRPWRDMPRRLESLWKPAWSETT